MVAVTVAGWIVVALLLIAAPAHAAPPATPSAEWLVEQVKTLAAPGMEGRASGMPGAERAALHIAGEFQRGGLTPGGDNGTWQQAFTVPTGIRLGDGNALRLVAPGPRALALGSEFVPLTMSADGAWEGDVVFAGFGITAPEIGWDDYAGLDVRGRLVLVLEGEPRGAEAFRRPDAYHYAERSHKVINAREHGAAGVLLAAHPDRARDALPALTGLGQPWSIFALAVSRTAADALLVPAGVSLAAAAAAIETGPAPKSFAVAAAASVTPDGASSASAPARVTPSAKMDHGWPSPVSGGSASPARSGCATSSTPAAPCSRALITLWLRSA